MNSRVYGKEIALIVLVVLAVLVIFILLGGGMMGFGMMDGYNSPWWEFLMLVFWAADIGGIAFLTIWSLRSSGPTTPLVQIPTNTPRGVEDVENRPLLR